MSLNENKIDLFCYLKIIYKRKILIGLITISFMVFSIIKAINTMPYWISEAKLLPLHNSAQNDMSSLAALAGLSLPQSDNTENFYKDILRSRDFLDTLADIQWKTDVYADSLVTLADIYGLVPDTSTDHWEYAFKQQILDFIIENELISFEKASTGTMTLGVKTIDPILSFEINNFLIDYLDYFNRYKRKTNISLKKNLIETRLREFESQLKESEHRLQIYEEKNLSIRTPAALMMRERLKREVELNNSLYLEMRKQYELLKIDEVDNAQVLDVLQKPTIPVKGESKRRKLVMMGSALGFILSLFLAFGLNWWSKFGRNLTAELKS